MCFDLYDLDGSGALECTSTRCFTTASATWGQIVFMEEVIKCIDVNMDTVLQRDEFYSACVANPLIFECFIDGIFCENVVSPEARNMAGGDGNVVQRRKTMQAAQVEHFSWSTVQMLWSQMLLQARTLTA